MRRGEVWWASLPAPFGKRPALTLSRDRAYNIRTAVTVAPVTRSIRGIPVEVALGPEDGMPTACVVNLDDILTISKDRLIERITTLTQDKMKAVSRAIVFALDLEDRN